MLRGSATDEFLRGLLDRSTTQKLARYLGSVDRSGEDRRVDAIDDEQAAVDEGVPSEAELDHIEVS